LTNVERFQSETFVSLLHREAPSQPPRVAQLADAVLADW
jgi:hypothetical protein